MDTEKTINLLIIHDHVDEANKLVSLLRNADFKLDPHHAGDALELKTRLQERNWDLTIIEYSAQSIPVKTVLHQIRRLEKDIPVMLITPEYNSSLMLEGLKMGAAEVVPMDEDQQIIQFVRRTLNNLDQRRKLRYWKRRFTESESRFENLILSSQDGIAIIQEGTYVLVNDTFAHLFGYSNQDDMTLLPVFDSISNGSQPDFKKYLKPLSEENALDTENIQFEGLDDNNSPFLVRASASQIDFHGEQALQLLVKKEFLLQLDETQTSAVQTSVTQNNLVNDPGKIRLNDMVEAINIAIRKAARSGEDALLCYIQIDRYTTLQKQLGIGAAEEGVAQLSHFLHQYVGGQSTFGRIREDAYIFILNGTTGEEGLKFSKSLANAVLTPVFDTTNGSFSCTISIGLAAINEATTSADSCIENCMSAITDIHKENSSGEIGNGVKLYEFSFEVAATEISTKEIINIGKQLLKQNCIHLAFQPIICLQGPASEFYEVLTRVNPDSFQETIPDDFISKIFKTEIGKELDKYMITEAIKALKNKQQTAPKTKLFINLSEATLGDATFFNWLKSTLSSSDVPPDHIVFQLREIDIGHHLGRAVALFEKLKKIQSQTALTHFGLSINPLTILNKLNLDFVKLDHILVEKSQKDADGMTELTSLIKEIKNISLKAIVPFIESPAIIPSLWKANVDYLQGHYIQPPSTEMAYEFEQE